jgi:hypothetical protein
MLKTQNNKLVVMAHVCNPSYWGGRYGEALAKS